MSEKQTQRHLTILKYLPEAPSSITTIELKNKLERDGLHAPLRTIQRDLDCLSNHYNISRNETFRPHSWCRVKGLHPSAIEMTPSTALALSLTKQFLQGLLPSQLKNNLDSFFDQAELKLANTPKLASWTKCVASIPAGFQPLAPHIDPLIMPPLEQALMEGLRLLIFYRPRSVNQPKHYRINPLALVTRGTTIYLIATLADNDAFRHFALHRVQSAERLLEMRKIPLDFELNAYLKQGNLAFPIEELITLKLKVDFNLGYHLLETPLSLQQTISHSDDGKHFTIEADLPNTEELKWWLMSMSDISEVLAPQSLREALKRSLTIAQKKYSG